MKRVDAMAAALLVVGSSRSTAAPLDDFRARSRRFLRRGLLVSGALHLTLLAMVLWMASRGDEGIVRLTSGRIDVVRPIPPGFAIPPPPSPGVPPGNVKATQGVIQPVDQEFKFPLDIFDKVAPVSPTTGAGTTRSGEDDGHDRGAPPTEPDPSRAFEPNQVDKLPVEIFAPKPRYPDYELEAGITDRVVMKVLVDEEGVVRSVDRLSGKKAFVDSAKATLYRWRFKPALVKGKPVRVWLEIPVNFVL
jgi:TonB family protein